MSDATKCSETDTKRIPNGSAHHSAEVKMFLSIGDVPVHAVLENRATLFPFSATLVTIIDGHEYCTQVEFPALKLEWKRGEK
jgi:hypothetical protein